MKLVLREYLAMLRESGELDVLLPDLLLAMGIEPLTRPTRGTRQFGVDVAAVGPDPDEPTTGDRLLLFTVKRGNITRTEWNSGTQSLRPSLDEILDVYLGTMVRPEHAGLVKKVVVVTGGDMRQEVLLDWNSYVGLNQKRYPQYGTIEFAFWGGDRLAELMDEHLFDEFLFPEELQRQLRKTIALVDQPDAEPVHFYELVRTLLFERKFPRGLSDSEFKQRHKIFTLIELSLMVVFRWAEDAGNVRGACLAAERTLLTTWDWMRSADHLEVPKTRRSFERLVAVFRETMTALAARIGLRSGARDGLSTRDAVENSLSIFEIIGFLGVLTCGLAFDAEDAEKPDMRAELWSAARGTARILADVVRFNPASWQPRYDEHAIEIGIGLLALRMAGPPESEIAWVKALANRLVTAFRLKQHYPVSSDSYEDLLALQSSNPPGRDELLPFSTLVPLIAEWMAVLELAEPYQQFRDAILGEIPNTDLQIWYPDGSTEEHIYRGNAGRETGSTLSSIELPEVLSTFQDQLREVAAARDPWDALSCLREGWTWGALLSSRHFRTPLVPALWEDSLRAKS
jgi:hypothetical protein